MSKSLGNALTDIAHAGHKKAKSLKSAVDNHLESRKPSKAASTTLPQQRSALQLAPQAEPTPPSSSAEANEMMKEFMQNFIQQQATELGEKAKAAFAKDEDDEDEDPDD